EAVKAGLINFHDLNLQGGVIEIDGRVEAFTLGELLNNETVVVHIEKANPLVQGLYTAINQEFCRHSWSQVPFINREQDLGLPGLRMAKMSYHPHHLVEKFRIQLT
ncbi:MAG TPA: phosphatidylglycerol lysyltransferase domain-containing protein, partial [Desulfobaccales bacterium]